jgi:hypothetical protein
MSTELDEIRADLRELRHEVRRAEKRILAAIEDLRIRSGHDYQRTQKRLQYVRLHGEAIIRSLFVSPRLAAPEAIQARRFSLHSANEEDGVLLALLDATGVGTRTFVDLGSGASGGSCAILAFDLGWRGLMVEGRPESVARLEAELPHHVAARQAMLAPDTVNATLDEFLRTAGLSRDIDVLSLDIDSVDYWLLQELDLTPRVLVLEYNAYFGPVASVTVPRDFAGREQREYFGASLTALATLAHRKGYDLILCEQGGANAFFVRRELAPAIPRRTPAEAYRPLRDRTDKSPEQIFARLSAAGLHLVTVE